jgi:hypothetical protein
MDDVIKSHPEVAEFLDDSPNLTNSGAEVSISGQRFLIVTQTGPEEGGQVLFRIVDGKAQFVKADTFIDLGPTHIFLDAHHTAVGGCGPSTPADQQAVVAMMQSQVGQFSTSDGPDAGNLACVWAVRHIVQKALNRMITNTDGTSVFASELNACFGHSSDESVVPDGSIIISPTQTAVKGKHGHVGLLGARQPDGDRLIFSNSSADAVWEQNFTLNRWIAHFRDEKKLQVLFFPLPKKGTMPVG